MSFVQSKSAVSTSIWLSLLIIILAEQVASKWDDVDRCGSSSHSQTGTASSIAQSHISTEPYYIRFGASMINKTSRCGGALINDQHILTTAECAIHSQPDGNVYSSMGKYLGQISRSCTSGNKNRYKLADFGILRLSKKLEMNDEVRTICLQVRKYSHAKRRYFVVSGDLEFGNQTLSWRGSTRSGETCSDNPSLRCYAGRSALSEGQICEEDQGALIIDHPSRLLLRGLVLDPHTSNGACSREFKAIMLGDSNLDRVRKLLEKCETMR